MAVRKIDKIIKMGSHPLEDHFNIEKGSTEIVEYKSKTELADYKQYDEKDKELENDYQSIMDSALDLVETLKEQIASNQEPKYLARLAEVTGQQLNVALSAAEKKAKLKDNKDKLNQKKSSTTVNNYDTTIVMDRNSMLDAIMGRNDNDAAIDVEISEPEYPQIECDDD
jgi:hypothetical protein